MPISCRSQAQPSSRSLSSPDGIEGRADGAAVQRQRDTAHARRLRRIDHEAALQPAYRGVANVAVGGSRPAAHAATRRAQCRVALVQVDDHALAQRAAGRPQGLDAEVRGQRVEQSQAAGDHRTALFLQAGQVEAVDVAGTQAALDQPAQACWRDDAVVDAAGRQQLRHGADRARCAQRFLPVPRRKRFERFLEFGAGGDLSGAERGRGEAAIGKVLHRQADAADGERLGHPRLAASAEDHLGRAAADVDHQARHGARLQMRDAGIDQPRFLAAGDDFDRLAEGRLRVHQEGVAVAALRARSASRPPVPAIGSRPCSRYGKALQAGQAPLAGLARSAGRGHRARHPAALFPSGRRRAGNGHAASARSRDGSCWSPCRSRRAGRRRAAVGSAWPHCALAGMRVDCCLESAACPAGALPWNRDASTRCRKPDPRGQFAQGCA